MLRPFVLAGDYYARWDMRQPDGGIGSIDVLSACSAGTVSVYFNVFLVYNYVYRIIYFRINEYGSKRSMPSFICVERRNSY